MSIKLVRGDIINAKVDAIVNLVSSKNHITTDVENTIINGAGILQLMLERNLQEEIEQGNVVITNGGALNAKYIIHTEDPTWGGGEYREDLILQKCYMNALIAARELGCKSIAFPLIATGVKRYPKGRSIDIAVEVFSRYLINEEMRIYLFIYDDGSDEKASKGYYEVYDYVESSIRNYNAGKENAPPYYNKGDSVTFIKEFKEEFSNSIEELINSSKERSFCDVLNYYIDRNKDAGGKDSDIYNRAHIDKGYFYKLKRYERTNPGKIVVMSLAIALRLDIKEAEEFLSYAGYAFNPGSRVDLIFKFFISNEIWDMTELEKVFFDYDMLNCDGEIVENNVL